MVTPRVCLGGLRLGIGVGEWIAGVGPGEEDGVVVRQLVRDVRPLDPRSHQSALALSKAVSLSLGPARAFSIDIAPEEQLRGGEDKVQSHPRHRLQPFDRRPLEGEG
jgi:hypothetical protein